MISNDGLCLIQETYSEPVTRRHEPLKLDGRVNLIDFNTNGERFVVNPCRNCGLLVAYKPGTFSNDDH